MKLSLSEARGRIAVLNLERYKTKATQTTNWDLEEANLAEKEYRHFLLLLAINIKVKSTEFVVPTKRADKIWHEHILDTVPYRKSCMDIFDKFIDHYPGLEEGSDPFNKAMEHTQTLHQSLGGKDVGFVSTLFGTCPAKTEDRGTSGNSHTTEPSPASCSANCGAGCGGGCGAGCGA